MTYWIWRARRVNKAIFTALLLFVPILCQANSISRVTLLLSSKQPVYQLVAKSIHSSLHSSADIEEYTIDSINNISEPPEIVLTIGSTAFEKALNKFKASPIIASFLPRRVYEELLERTLRKPNNTTAVFIDQSMSRQLALARLIVPTGVTIGTVFGASSIHERERLYHAAKKTGFNIKSVALNSDDNPVNTLQPVIQESDVFLAIPDQSAFNRASAKWSLFLALRLKKPLIGFSEKYVDAGALAAVFSSPQQIGKHAAETLNTYLETEVLVGPAHPKYFTVKTNLKSIQTINIQMDDAVILQQQLGDSH
ncbi:ABC transporter substrate-binding protein [Neptunomonas japonica]|uniref:ABC transporter substrate-binding protein n=1 Tax=Neptunomonas japonica TaxID=417574 RepID=UPI0019166ECB|nr:ABC transporter substrate binding protein [Neptunomonas japonica]